MIGRGSGGVNGEHLSLRRCSRCNGAHTAPRLARFWCLPDHLIRPGASSAHLSHVVTWRGLDCGNIMTEDPMRKLFAGCLLLALLCTATYAAKKFPMTAASIVPAARGQVDIDKDKNGNIRVNMKIQYLARPENLTPPAVAYVVWLQDKGGTPENQGQLKIDKKMAASFKTVTPSKGFDLFVTAERDSGVKAPSGPEVLRATIQM
jgi:hypothetical protein